MLQKTKLSSKGQVVIPKGLREALGWENGQELVLEEIGNAILLRTVRKLPETTLKDVAGCLNYDGPAKSIDDMERAIAEGIREIQGRD